MNRQIRRVVLIEPKEKGFNVFSLFKVPRLGTPILATVLRDKGYQVKVFVEKIAPIRWRDIFRADLVGISLVSNTALVGYRLAERIRARGIPVVFGGPHATFEPGEALQYGDYVLRGEGEESLVQLIETLNRAGDLSTVPGLSYWDGQKVLHNVAARFCPDINVTPDFSLVHGFKKFYDRRIHFGFAPLEVLTTRGCPYGCKFCSVIKMSGRKMRERDVDAVVDEIEHLIKTYRKRNIFFVDDNFTANRARAKLLLRKIIERKLPVKLSAQVRAETARDIELLQLMKLAGMHMVQIGLESVNPETLRALNKRQQVEEMRAAIKTFVKMGIVVYGMFVIGSDYDTPPVVDATVEFARTLDLVAIQLLPLGPLPGTEMTAEYQRENRIVTREWNRYGGNHVLIFPRRMRPSVTQQVIFSGYKKFYSLARSWRYLWKGKGVYAGTNLYGFLATRFFEWQMRSYVKFLRAVEVGKYRQAARGDELIEPVVHQAEEAPLSDLSRRKLLRLFGRRLRIFLHRSLIKDLPATRFQPIALRLPSRLSKRWQQVPDKIKRVLKRSHRPLVLDFSQLIVTDPRFWVKIHEAVKPFGRRVRLLVRAGTGALFSKLGLKNLRKLTIGGG